MQEEQYDELLNELYGTFKIGYCEYYASDILKELDPIAYRVGLADIESFEEEEQEEEEANA